MGARPFRTRTIGLPTSAPHGMVFGMGTLYTYLLAFIQHWWAIVAAGMFFGADEVLQRWGADEVLRKWAPNMMERLSEKLRPYRRSLQILFLIGAVFYAGFAAWRDEAVLRVQAEKSLIKAEAERDEAYRQINNLSMQNGPVTPTLDFYSASGYTRPLSPEQKKTIASLGSKEISEIGRLTIVYHSTAETINYVISFIDAFKVSGIDVVEGGSASPDGPEQTGVMLSCENPAELTDAAQRVRKILEAAHIKVRPMPMLRSIKKYHIAGCAIFIGPSIQ